VHIPKFEFDPYEHTYTRDGIKIPSVTELLPMDFPLHFTEEMMEQWRREGQENHHAVQLYIKTKKIKPGYEHYIENFKLFIDESFPHLGALVDCELTVFSRSPIYGGTLDLLFEKGIVDLKRTYAKPYIHALQCAGYDYAARDLGIYKTLKNKYYILVLEKQITGYSLKSVSNPAAMDIFLKMVQRYWIDKRIQEYLKTGW